jgi:anti-sigma regulatory factor (Ser/Thr protein kinase)
MGTPVGTELPQRVTSNRGARLDKPVFGSAALRKIPLQPRPKAARAALFPVEPKSPEKAREVTRCFLGNCQGISTETIDIAVLLVSELVTNAYVAMTETTNGISCIDLSLRLFNNRRLLVEVTDSSPRVPLLAASGPDSVNGRGLTLVDEMSQQWGYFWHRGRKIVYVILSVTDSVNATKHGQRAS